MGNTKSTESIPKKSTRRKSATTPSTSSSSRPSVSSQGNRKPLLSISQRQIIKGCVDNSKDDLGERIFRRVLEKRDDFKQFIDNLSKAQRYENSNYLKQFLLGIVESLTDIDEINRISEEYGCNHVQFRLYGFKPDFFAATADAVATECTFLDQAAHLTSETATAWYLLTTHVFSAVRDGYYAELRRQRKCSNAFRARVSVDVVSTGTDDGTSLSSATRRSNSPQEEIAEKFEQKSNQTDDNDNEPSGNFLSPPQIY
ncbi:CRE-GLB-11 protein [Caenorhabditis remanei]|uniref:CRE-GLB-11 protein n=1 Tax=Caenorhabditis remanei TaxID=31234 RepID=E3M8F2_CAERE|nr:CRE-GLB-11 protein [Caenorhabditis remanei]